MTIGEVIKSSRKNLKMTQDDVAQFVGTTKGTVSRWESGDIHKISSDMVVKLCNVLQIDPSLFLQREEVLMPDEAQIIDAYRLSNEGIKASIRILLGIKDEQ